MSRHRVATTAALLAFSGCKGADRPRTPPAASQTLQIERSGLRSVASDGGQVFVGFHEGDLSTVVAHRGGTVVWTATVKGARVGPIALGSSLYATFAGTDTIDGVPVRGEPAGAVVAMDLATGKTVWRIALESNDWVTIADVAALSDGGAIVVGAFAGSLRAGASVVGSGGLADGFILALSPTGAVTWLRRMGGSGADAVQAVAVRGPAIAIAGIYQNTAEVGGVELPAFEDSTPNPDGYVALLDATGARKWAQPFGGPMLESVGGVAIDSDGRVVLAANVRGDVSVSGRTLHARGPGDGLVAWWEHDGAPRIADLVGGDGADSLWGITAVDDRVVVLGERAGAAYLGLWQANATHADVPLDAPADQALVTLRGVPGGYVLGVAAQNQRMTVMKSTVLVRGVR